MDKESAEKRLASAAEFEKRSEWEAALRFYHLAAAEATERGQRIAAFAGMVRVGENWTSKHFVLLAIGWLGVLSTVAGVALWWIALANITIKIPDPIYGVTTKSALDPAAVGIGFAWIASAITGCYLLAKFAGALRKLDLIDDRLRLVQAHTEEPH